MGRLAAKLVAWLSVAAGLALASVFVLRDPERREPARPRPTPRPAVARPRPTPSPLTPAPTPSPSPLTELEKRLARGRILASDRDPGGVAFLEELVRDAKAASDRLVAEAAAAELEKLRAVLLVEARKQAQWLEAEARELLGAGSNAATGRLAEAIEAWQTVGDAARTAKLEGELETMRADLRRREVERVQERARAALAGDSAVDEAEEIKKLWDLLQRGDVTAFDPLLEKLIEAAKSAHQTKACGRALRHVALARRALEVMLAFARDDRPGKVWEGRLDDRELRCRLDEGGRAIQEGDGLAALGHLDLAALCRLDGKAAYDPRVLYLYGRALEADGRLGEARDSYRAAIGTLTFLPPDAPLELIRYLARRSARHRAVTVHSPGIGPSWRRLPRARYTLFVETEESAAPVERVIEAARAAAVERLGLGDPVRIQAKTVLFVFATEDGYHEADGAPKGWAIGHATADTLEDGRGNAIMTFDPRSRLKDPKSARPDHDGLPYLENVLTHEWAHVLVDQHTKGAFLPSWAAEGVASFVESEPWRGERLRYSAPLWVNRGEDEANLAHWERMLLHWIDPRYAGDDGGAAARFYSESLLAFDVVARHAGSVRSALELSRRIDDAWPRPRKLAKDPNGPALEKADPVPDVFNALGFEKSDDFIALAKTLVPPKESVAPPIEAGANK